MQHNQEITEERRIKLLKNKIWSIAFTSGSITMTVLYWVSQLPKAQQSSVVAALTAALGAK